VKPEFRTIIQRPREETRAELSEENRQRVLNVNKDNARDFMRYLSQFHVLEQAKILHAIDKPTINDIAHSWAKEEFTALAQELKPYLLGD